MIFMNTPNNTKDFVVVNDEVSILLHSNGFIPMYRDLRFTYYRRNKEILDFLERRVGE